MNPAKAAEITAEHVLMLSMLASSAIGGTLLSMESTDSETKVFIASLIGGTLGSLVSLATFGAPTVNAMARQSITNIFMAVIFGPIATFWTAKLTGFPPTVYLIVAVSGSIGIGGIAVLHAIGPLVLKSLVGIVPRVLNQSFHQSAESTKTDNTK